jgi:hypothetical protein
MGAGIGLGEVVLLVLVAAAVFGTTRMPGAGDFLARWLRGDDPSRPSLPEKRPSGGWSAVDWMLLLTTLAIAGTLTAAVACP